MPISVLQAVNGTTVSGSTCKAVLATTTTGNTIVVAASGYNTGGGITVTGVAISPGAGTFSKQIAQAGSSAIASIEYWAAANITGGTTPTVTVTFSSAPSSSTDADIWVYEIAGMPTTLTTDGTAVGTSSSGTALLTSAITTTNNNDIIFAAFSPANVITSGEAGWTTLFGANTGGLSEYKVFTSAQTGLKASATGNGGAWLAIIFALKGTGAPGINTTLLINPKAILTLNALRIAEAAWSAAPKAILTPKAARIGLTSMTFTPKATLTMGEIVTANKTITFGPKATLTMLPTTIHNAKITFSPKTTLVLNPQIAGGAAVAQILSNMQIRLWPTAGGN